MDLCVYPGKFPSPFFLAEHLCRVIVDPEVHAICFHDCVVFMNLGDDSFPASATIEFVPVPCYLSSFFHVLQSAILLSSFAFCSCILPSLPCDSKAIKPLILCQEKVQIKNDFFHLASILSRQVFAPALIVYSCIVFHTHQAKDIHNDYESLLYYKMSLCTQKQGGMHVYNQIF